ncbi:Transcriptional repressor of the fructose operon, DeoR family [Streptococcus sp. HSISB1]|nr:Transcriptional repressor of the fructose operon, DeoR family [Streptococcus sp. HSISB1]
MISSDEVIFVDAGTTNELLLGYLNQDNLTVVTNSIHHAAKLVDKNVKTIIIGGHVKNQLMQVSE